MAENGGQHMRIGLDLTSGFLVFSRMAAILKRYLEYNRFITIEAYDRTRHYDLLVTNNPIHKKEQTPVYYLKNDLDMEDFGRDSSVIIHLKGLVVSGLFCEIYTISSHFFKIKKIDEQESALFCILVTVKRNPLKILSGGQHMSQEKYIMAIDQGTTSSRAIIFNKKRGKG